jgi:uncharacterized BrkB/YihY/UPF0761 family membrane protein
VEPGSVVPVGTAIAGALTPAFLLAGVMTALRVLSERRNRSVDRVHAAFHGHEPELDVARVRLRARLALLAMVFCILAAILVCALVAATFLALLYDLPLRSGLIALMLGAMGMLGAGLTSFLVEALLARTDLPPEQRR